jgi:ketosteroid isomerase-like protein
MPVLATADIDVVRQLEQQWLAAELAGNVAALLDLCCDDILFVPPSGPPIRGKVAIRNWLSMPQDRIEDIRLTPITLDGDASVAFKVATFETRLASTTVTGTHIWVLRRQPDSTWRVALVAWSLQCAY